MLLKSTKFFFDSEGVLDSGLELGYLLPTLSYWDLTVGITSGYRYGHAHTAGSEPKVPTHYLRLENFTPFSNTDGLKWGFNYLGRTDSQSQQMSIAGIDLVAKWRKQKKLSYLVQSELWFRSTKAPEQGQSRQAGLYIFNQFGLSHNLSTGFRIDGYKDLDKTDSISGNQLNNISYSFVPQLTFKSSEFTTFRASLSHSFTREEGVTTEEDTQLQMQFIFIIGAHPAHNF